MLARRESESIKIGNDIVLTISRIQEHVESGQVSVRIGIEAPENVLVLRGDLASRCEPIRRHEAVIEPSINRPELQRS